METFLNNTKMIYMYKAIQFMQTVPGRFPVDPGDHPSLMPLNLGWTNWPFDSIIYMELPTVFSLPSTALCCILSSDVDDNLLWDVWNPDTGDVWFSSDDSRKWNAWLDSATTGSCVGGGIGLDSEVGGGFSSPIQYCFDPFIINFTPNPMGNCKSTTWGS